MGPTGGVWEILERRRLDRQLVKAPREVVPARLTYYVESVTPHDYRRQ